jgi:hypothetical protein
MRTDVAIRHDGFKALFENLDPVEAERYISLLRREGSDYTVWRETLWEGLSVREISDAASLHWHAKHADVSLEAGD